MSLKKKLTQYSEMPEGMFMKIFITLLFAYLPFVFLSSILSSFGIGQVIFIEEKFGGIKGALIFLCFTPIIVLMISTFFYVALYFGNSVLRKIIKILPD